ncbi:16S rRNA (guanine(966)-N(2))-methyltransferase RsmD [Georgenia thermotolerans]|uniref:16S rRNA (Guanine(966)-N(2))-methyltransferase RsmD n=1 Tax=Georgenia thermotolerans TaxID=527326 RepID=A0A7J5UQB1_9MICO|nr:16S rRNA (guanine(966)-N(2))-methyltransferase RsmD [Georgenia thermotolerans]KAE8764411.1 16S rRNA (guanine(966)-N(2))-methyltransferase RsmD [Georgenia thermotolerans]
MTRIVAGSAGGRTLQVPRNGTRPTSERVREALFSRLEHLGVVGGARVLDLYAGSGALGLEAASRGAARVTLVESAKAAAQLCRRNAGALGLGDRVDVVAAKVQTYLAGPPPAGAAPADLVLLDPPYDVTEEDLAAVLALLAPAAARTEPAPDGAPAQTAWLAPDGAPARTTWLAPDAVVVVERSKRSPEPTWPAGLAPFDDRGYGDTAVWFAEPVGDQG